VRNQEGTEDSNIDQIDVIADLMMNHHVNLYVTDRKRDQSEKTHFNQTAKLLDNGNNSVLAPRQADPYQVSSYLRQG